MIKNSDLFYSRAAEFQSKRREATAAYEKRLAELEKAKGSLLYKEETEKAAQTLATSLQALQSEYGEYFRISLDAMTDANGKRGVTPPTAEQLAILQALKMRDSVSQRELDQAANSCKNCALALSVISEIAKQNSYSRVYHAENGEMSADEVEKIIGDLRSGIDDFLAHDTARSARVVAEHNTRLYGTTGSERPLKKRPLFTDKESCFNSLIPFGMSTETYTAFCNAIDSEGTADK